MRSGSAMYAMYRHEIDEEKRALERPFSGSRRIAKPELLDNTAILDQSQSFPEALKYTYILIG
jgi:hypothetical protein